MIEIRYAGVVVGRSSIIRELDTRGLFLGMTEPLPVGTAVELKVGDSIVSGRVEVVSESQELARAGMRIRFAEPAAAALFGAPVEAPPELAPPLWFATRPPPDGAQTDSADDTVELPSRSQAELAAVPDGPTGASPSGHRRIVVDASSEKAQDAAADGETDPGGVEAPLEAGGSGPLAATDERIPAPDPSAFGARKGRRNRRR